MRRTEIQHHSDEQVSEYVAKALALVEQLDPPADLREAVLAQAVTLFSAKQITFEQISPLSPGMAIPRGR